ncbi:hypothetical protein CO115_02655 [Candidatus Falkowbacteria bacterium CG_4_9_14_3_um_filter_36_9]|uniref:Uncharacterized protein n=2 Tax=Candidatus Falkowiibacteriota TaxID=1752728 RepID=A0A1J4T9C8_9BACT|nr:MAG: hypothetical protein AUJ27_02425 [Candidatus Falkowbacteria bacterium CG1_02_37_44]PIV51739.1 MAG: hypothetical protein COS18_02155 [Candidatus Falkowbacteria bacterium CG02_land_8_20_14_3_00_36_14]PIX10757.1 MAG: hypothetical protein COZ73_04965 [Candidatus Falkowbacteria bacterium CG_4_8_14_3_um_filter_36_11]PJA10962.1 MAG: hypothetical protein COX67_02315 [Candidatus Falkowbacteria bacterium CG_4_10_14_0_2_um_filter_36_22]PJB19574.1 MAG: hypothetical protein CO115_02655 [Candidatus F
MGLLIVEIFFTVLSLVYFTFHAIRNERDDGLVALAWLASGVICFLYAYHDLIKLGIITM